MSNSADLASCESADIQRRILELIEGASSIAISGHTSPDGDALGSVLGLGLSLMKFFPNKDIALLLADDDPVPRIYRFMEGSDRLVPASAYTGNPDLFISVDVPVVERLNNSAEVLRRSKHVVCFDHHPAREEFAELSLRRVEAAACAMIIDRFLDNCGIVARDGVATCLLCGLVTDTGRFQYQNADAAASRCRRSPEVLPSYQCRRSGRWEGNNPLPPALCVPPLRHAPQTTFLFPHVFPSFALYRTKVSSHHRLKTEHRHLPHPLWDRIRSRLHCRFPAKAFWAVQ